MSIMAKTLKWRVVQISFVLAFMFLGLFFLAKHPILFFPFIIMIYFAIGVIGFTDQKEKSLGEIIFDGIFWNLL